MTKSKNPNDIMNNDFVYQFAASKVFGVKQVSCYAARFSGLYRSTDGGMT
jgi:hypothetical protein